MSEEPTEIPLTLAALRALTVGPRLRLLRLVAARRQTLAELAKSSRLPKSSVHVHMSALAKVGLVTRREDDRLWVYYVPTPTGEAIARTSRPRIVVLLSTALVAGVLSGILFGIRAAVSPVAQPNGAWGVEPLGVPKAADTLLVTALVCLAAFVLLGLVSTLLLWRSKRPNSVPAA